jgi:hypothetical protein
MYKYLTFTDVNSHNHKIKPKIIFFYDSSKNISSNIINELKTNYYNNKNIELIFIDIFNNNKYKNTIKQVPLIYFIDYNTNLILNYPSDMPLNYYNLNNFIVNSFGLISNED